MTGRLRHRRPRLRCDRRRLSWARHLPSRRFALFCLVAVGFAWFVTGLRPFTESAYEAVFAVPAILLVVGVLRTPARRVRPAPLTWRSTAPWIAIAVSAACMEAAGLALGGRSVVVPTLSTVVDFSLRWHVVRFVLFCGWLKVGTGPLSGPWTAAARPEPPHGDSRC